MRIGSRWRALSLVLLAALATGCGAELGGPIRIDEPPETFSYYDYAPAWSPDGSRIAYERRRGSLSTMGIWIADTAGVATQQVVGGAWHSPDWSPDGTHLAISQVGIYSVRITGDSLKAITTKGYRPRWSPNGNELAFEDFDAYSMGSIELVSRDGTGMRSLRTAGGDWMQPDWSPDGTRLVHVRRPSPEEIFVMDTTGHAEQRLTTDEYSDLDPAWSPDGQWIAWTSVRQAGSEVWLMKPDGTEAHALTPGGSPSWSPDSRRIAFARTVSNTVLLFAIDLATLRIRQITH